MTRPWISAGLAALASAAAACNSYEQAYSGERWPPASKCSVVLAALPPVQPVTGAAGGS